MSFAIELLSENELDETGNDVARVGLITIGSYSERFLAPTHYWSASDYEEHWKQGISRLIHGSDQSSLITEMYDPETANFIHWWPMYRVEGTVLIQNHILLLHTVSTPFDPTNPFLHVPARETTNEDGDPISEWAVSLEDLIRFVSDRKANN